MLEFCGTYDLTNSHVTGMCEAYPEDVGGATASVEPPRLRVLLITADAGLARRAERGLTHMPRFEPQITSAGSVAAARFALLADDFDQVLIDGAMRQPDGAYVATALSAALEHCPVLALGDVLAEDGSLSARALQAAIHASIIAFAQRCTSSGL